MSDKWEETGTGVTAPAGYSNKDAAAAVRAAGAEPIVHHRGPDFRAVLASTLERLHVPAPAFGAWAIALVEVLGGIALVVGALVAVATALLVVEMLVAMFLVHLPNGFAAVHIVGMTPQGPQFGMPGVEVNLLYIAGLLALLLGGAGPLSIDERVGGKERAGWIPRARTRTA